MADGSANQVENTTTTTESDRIHPARTLWDQSSLAKQPIRYRLENIDRKVTTAFTLMLMLNQHARGRYDSEASDGISYNWLTDEQAMALGDAVEELLMDAVGKMDRVRES